MKALVYLIAFLLSIQFSFAQQIEKYFDYNWRTCNPNEARFYSLIEKTDSGWLRRDYFVIEKKMQMKGMYLDSACSIANGVFYRFYSNGKLKSIGKYVNNKKEDVWIGYHLNGYMSDSAYYKDGLPAGNAMEWHDNGYPSDSTHYNEDGSTVKIRWFPNGNISEAGRLNPAGKLTGKWQFFHSNGQLSASETYNNGILVDRKYFTEEGTPMTDTTDHTRKAEFKGGINAWSKYLEKNLYFPAHYQIVNGDKAVVVVNFTIDENGKITNTDLHTPFHPAFNDIALKVVRTSPAWLPAIDHNRRVLYRHRQAIFFAQEKL